MAAVRLAELLMARHQSLYAKHFRKEGVVHALQALSASHSDAVERAQVQPSSRPCCTQAQPARCKPLLFDLQRPELCCWAAACACPTK